MVLSEAHMHMTETVERGSQLLILATNSACAYSQGRKSVTFGAINIDVWDVYPVLNEYTCTCMTVECQLVTASQEHDRLHDVTEPSSV